MEDDKFIKELKENVTRDKLPTLEDLGSGYTSPFSEEKKEELPTKQAKEQAQELPKKSENILDKVKELYQDGKSVEEIYQILADLGYPYDKIEEAILEITKEENEGKEVVEPTKEEEIKKPTPPPAPPPKKVEELKDIEERLEAGIEKPTKVGRAYSEREVEYAPLFIKIEKYREALENIENLENYLKGMTRLFEIINELERIRATNISALNKMYQKALKTASKLYSGLLKPKGMKFEGELASESEIEKLDSVIKDLNKELAMLREEIDKIRAIE